MQYGTNLKAFLVYSCSYQLLSYDRVCEMVSDLFGRSLSRATVVAAVEECSRNLTGVSERIRELLHGARILHVDETGMRVAGTRPNGTPIQRRTSPRLSGSALRLRIQVEPATVTRSPLSAVVPVRSIRRMDGSSVVGASPTRSSRPGTVSMTFTAVSVLARVVSQPSMPRMLKMSLAAAENGSRLVTYGCK